MSREQTIKAKYGLDDETGRYIVNIKKLQVCVWVIIVILLFFFTRIIMHENEKGMKEVALEEVREAMVETVHNTKLHIESVTIRVEDQTMANILDIRQRIERERVENLAGILECMRVSEENRIGQAIEVVYITGEKDAQHVTAFDRNIEHIDVNEANVIYTYAPVCNHLELDDKDIYIFITQHNLDEFVKEEMRNYLHSEQYDGNQYVWVNEVIDMQGGLNYAVRKIHPSMPELEGEWLSTFEEDVVGNQPYNTELKGIRKEGKVFHSYYFKNKVDDEITEKYSYAEYYEPFKWIIATGETLEDVYSHSESISESNMNYFMTLVVILCSIFALTSWLTMKIINEQVYRFRRRIMAQSEVLEDMYTTMAIGFLRVKIAPEGVDILRINPRGLDLLGISHNHVNRFNMREHLKFSLSEEEAKAITALCWSLEEQWASAVVEYPVKGANGKKALLNVRITLVDFEGDARILQIIYQDVTEERERQALAINEAEEKATLDSLTQLKNKKAIEEIIRDRIESAKETGKNVAVGFVDIDNFRDYNTKYGHLQGDEVIKYVANVLKEHIHGDIGRIGGDEFTFCLVDTSYEELQPAMESIRVCLNDGIIITESGEKVPTPCSIGVIIENDKSLTYEVVLEHADAIMYKVKEKGKNSYLIWEN